MKSILSIIILISFVAISQAQEFTKEYQFKGIDTLLVELNHIKANTERKVVYFQVYYNDAWVIVDSLTIKENKKIEWKISKPYLADRRLNARFKFKGIDKKDIKRVHRKVRSKLSRIPIEKK